MATMSKQNQECNCLFLGSKEPHSKEKKFFTSKKKFTNETAILKTSYIGAVSCKVAKLFGLQVEQLPCEKNAVTIENMDFCK